MERLYIQAHVKDTEKERIEVDISSCIALFILQYCDHKTGCSIMVEKKRQNSCVINLPTSCLNSVNVNYIEKNTAPESVLQCTLPAVTSENNIVICGLSSVVRKLIFLANENDRSSLVMKLLGHHNNCLRAPAEVSVWTRFCEVEIPCLVEKIMEESRKNSSDVLCSMDLPSELYKLENNFKEPSIICNKRKDKKESWLVKKQMAEKAAKNGREPLKTSDESQASDSSKHIFAEGPVMTLTDVLLLPCLTIILNQWKDKADVIQSSLPLVCQWMRMLLQKERLKRILTDFELPLLEWNILNGRTVSDLINTDLAQQFEDVSIRTQSNTKIKIDDSKCLRAVEKLKIAGIFVNFKPHPYLSELTLPWGEMPEAVHPKNGNLPVKRLQKKCHQLQNMVAAVISIVKEENTIVDFCAGGGHVAILLAYLLPACKVIMVENKEESINRAITRVKELDLKNVTIFQGNLDYFHGNFDIGVSLHACGVATDLVIQQCIDKKASFVVCPCCYGSVQNTHTVTYPRSQKYQNTSITYEAYIQLGHAADQTEFAIADQKEGKMFMGYIDEDRSALAVERGYNVTLCTMEPANCTPKNNLLIGEKLNS